MLKHKSRIVMTKKWYMYLSQIIVLSKSCCQCTAYSVWNMATPATIMCMSGKTDLSRMSSDSSNRSTPNIVLQDLAHQRKNLVYKLCNIAPNIKRNVERIRRGNLCTHSLHNEKTIKLNNREEKG